VAGRGGLPPHRSEAIAKSAGPHYAPGVRAFALVEFGDSEAIDLFLREEDARRALEEALRDEPEWGRDALREAGQARRPRIFGELARQRTESTPVVLLR
jgi:hypothetical protein